jgi:hypothetical protein
MRKILMVMRKYIEIGGQISGEIIIRIKIEIVIKLIKCKEGITVRMII